jgi:hypothetical protein
MTIDYNLIISLKTDEATGRGLRFRKEAIYVGEFFAPQPDGGKQQFTVTKADLEHWRDSINLQLDRGIRVDVPSGHTTESEASRGQVVAADVGKDSQGRDALFVDIEFADKEAARMAKTAEVSIFSPPSWEDGLGNTYSRPIRHVALTQQPVIPNLDAFTLVASLDEKVSSMEFLTQIAQALGLEVDAEDEATLTQQILEAISPEEDDMEDDETELEDMVEEDEDDDELEFEFEEDSDEDENEDELSFSLPASAKAEIVAGRKARIDLLLSKGQITPAQAKALAKKHCVTTGLVLSSDAFDEAIELLSLSSPRKTGSRTGAQISRGSQRLSPLEADAERRAKSQV